LTDTDDDELVVAAQRMIDDDSRATVSAWPRAAALLARQALERALADYWHARLPGAERLNMRAQLNCAQVYLGRELAGELTYTWHALSRATHHHPYELDPTREELSSHVQSTGRLVKALAAKAAPARDRAAS
jgi:hypothetical protein